MRIATSQIFTQSVDAMLAKQRELARTELQVASGKRILAPSDDPSASVQVLDLKESQQRLAQFRRNADAATARLGHEEAALKGVGDLLQRVRELAVQGNSDTYDQVARTAIAAEVRALSDNFLDLANTRDASGEYLFAGFKTGTRPFDTVGGTLNYRGDQGQRLVQIGESREVAVGDPGTLFTGFAAAGGGQTDVWAVMDRLATNLEANSRDPAALTDIDTAMGQLLTTHARVGARMNAIDEQNRANESFDLALSEVRSSLEDLDYAEAISRFNQQLVALQASQQAFIKVQDLSLFNYLR
jgi:flagellar hook-associated protein 3 FlgL